MRHVVFRDFAKHPDRVDPLHREKWRRPRARGGLDQIAPIHQPPRYHSIERRHDLRIGKQRLDPLHSSGGEVDLRGGKGAVRFSNAHIGLGDVPRWRAPRRASGRRCRVP